MSAIAVFELGRQSLWGGLPSSPGGLGVATDLRGVAAAQLETFTALFRHNCSLLEVNLSSSHLSYGVVVCRWAIDETADGVE